MSSPLATQLRNRAITLRRFARQLEDLEVLTLHLRAGEATWVGPSPEACHRHLVALRGGFLAAVDELRRTAARLERKAADLDAAARATAGVA